MTELPDDVLAALAAEHTMFANPEAAPFNYNQAESTSPTEFAAMVEKVMRDMLAAPTRRHGSADYPHITWPGGHTCGECGADVTALTAAAEDARRKEAARVAREAELAAMTPEERDRDEWERTVRERLQSALYALSEGYSFTWTAPGVFGVPGQPESLQVRHAGQPWRLAGSEETEHDG